jgi:hypothetical protein
MSPQLRIFAVKKDGKNSSKNLLYARGCIGAFSISSCHRGGNVY